MKYNVKIFFSGYATIEVRAKDVSQAILKGRKRVYQLLESKRSWATHNHPVVWSIIDTLEPWPDADDAQEISFSIKK